MRRHISILGALLLMVLVHVDWHLGRGHHHRMSGEWRYHWLLGLAAFFLLVIYVARKWPGNPLPVAILTAAVGLFLGQIVEPLLEVVGYHFPIAIVLSPERWRVFFEFCAAGLAGFVLAALVVRRGSKRMQCRGQPMS